MNLTQFKLLAAALIGGALMYIPTCRVVGDVCRPRGREWIFDLSSRSTADTGLLIVQVGIACALLLAVYAIFVKKA